MSSLDWITANVLARIASSKSNIRRSHSNRRSRMPSAEVLLLRVLVIAQSAGSRDGQTRNGRRAAPPEVRAIKPGGVGVLARRLVSLESRTKPNAVQRPRAAISLTTDNRVAPWN
jgi:hypothetical protein